LVSVRPDFFVAVKEMPNGSGESISIYPNPATDYINITNAQNGSIYSIYNITGRLQLTGTICGPVNIQALVPGVYFLHVMNRVLKLTVSP
jgi:hypothetical protein